MIFSNSTLEEMRREAESSNNELALAILKKIDDGGDDEELFILSKSEKYENEVRYYAVHDINNDILDFTVNLLKEVFSSKGGKRKTLEAIQQFRLDVENVPADQVEILEHFLNGVPDQFEKFVKAR